MTELKGDLVGRDIVQISCGDFHGAAIDSLGNLYTWGGGKTTQFNRGQCGHGSTDFVEVPTRVQGLSDKRITKVSCGAQHTLVLTDEKQVYAFGSGIYGECGQGDLRNLLTPRQIELPKIKNKAYQQDMLMKELLREVDNRL